MELQMFDSVKLEKENAVARFDRFLRIATPWQFLEAAVVLAVFAWSSSSRAVPSFLKLTAPSFLEFSSGHLFNHHVVFVIGNAIIVLLFMLCRGGSGDAVNLSTGGDLYDDYAKYSEAAAAASRREPALPPRESGIASEEETNKAIPPPQCDGLSEAAAASRREPALLPPRESGIAFEEETNKAIPPPQCDELAEAVEKATRQIERFQRTQSEKLKREIAVRPRRRSETTESCGAAEEIERLSSEEFRRRVDAFIDKHWSRRRRRTAAVKENYQLLKMEEFAVKNKKVLCLGV